ncbi:MAG: hydantoinase B/oxoprolinase family protein [Chloroflexi bacterium AL-W]|nr:hydantoinase B/oxoprolinase family protein [Chloroflexi bacterium AL-N1]NOK66621.1 hydantoinase B/oxoprolinase family protein [Chloroflexi bacterium AL-N10]NOK72009.1 hydantoinase B/oxoprolinase family protein [Chloroflexi bacterium AL-N5]NOK81266.1 hydantoinase B/oxoprolinase family protein [Chloroflexi bacterium AL-W]NOK89539.1 hydantoinase B/oxoprolinase family protein [Chloroflexi bacterium AL-N15]
MTNAHVDSISLEVFRHRCTAVAEEMGVALGRSAFSPNIKERRDFSCAVFDVAGRMVAQAAHIPVHLGAMPRSVEAALACHTLHPGDVVVLNDPYQGGTHLPDLTTVAPVFDENECIGYTATRAHHADVGGITPGSMPMSRELLQEGLIIPPVKLVSGGVINEALIDLICRNSRTGDERRGDLVAQLACHRVGATRLVQLTEQHGKTWLVQHMEALLRYGERHMRTLLESIPDGVYVFEDYLDDDGQDSKPLVLRVSITVQNDSAVIDFGGTAPQCRGPLNAPRAVAEAAVLYCFRCLASSDMPASAGAFTPLTMVIPEGSVLNPRPPAPVAGGNVETSQRVVDVVFGALAQVLPDRIPAASAGTMNNLTFGGVDPVSGISFAYYETLGGGMGARPTAPGLDGVQVHMTNTLNTPIETLERLLPVQVQQYALRTGSGGAGAQRGGDGLVREIKFLVPVTLSLLTERRTMSPYGLNGGQMGTPGRNTLTSTDGAIQILPGKTTVFVDEGSLLRVETPGGGGWGKPSASADE